MVSCLLSTLISQNSSLRLHVIIFKEIQNGFDSHRAQPVWWVADVTWVVNGTQLLAELSLVGELELGRDSVVSAAQHLDTSALDVVSRRELGAGSTTEGDRLCARSGNSLECVSNDVLD